MRKNKPSTLLFPSHTNGNGKFQKDSSRNVYQFKIYVKQNIIQNTEQVHIINKDTSKYISSAPDLLGKGEFGEVFTGLLDRKDSGQSRESIAIKEAQRQFIKPLLMEIKILSYIGQHPNIVNMLGASVSDLRKGYNFVSGELSPT